MCPDARVKVVMNYLIPNSTCAEISDVGRRGQNELNPSPLEELPGADIAIGMARKFAGFSGRFRLKKPQQNIVSRGLFFYYFPAPVSRKFSLLA